MGSFRHCSPSIRNGRFWNPYIQKLPCSLGLLRRISPTGRRLRAVLNSQWSLLESVYPKAPLLIGLTPPHFAHWAAATCAPLAGADLRPSGSALKGHRRLRIPSSAFGGQHHCLSYALSEKSRAFFAYTKRKRKDFFASPFPQFYMIHFFIILFVHTT